MKDLTKTASPAIAEETEEVKADATKVVDEKTEETPASEVVDEKTEESEKTEKVVDEKTEEVVEDVVDEKTEESEKTEKVVDEKTEEVVEEDTAIAEPLEDLLNTKKLSVKFKASVTEAFDTAVAAGVKEHTDKLDEESETKIKEAADVLVAEEKIKLEKSAEETLSGLSEKMLEYTDYAVAQWAKDNQLVLENEAKAAKYDKMLESFVNVLSTFGVDINEEMTKAHEEVISVSKEASSVIEEQANKETERNVELVKENLELRKNIVFMKETEDLSDIKKDKLKDVIDVVEFENDEEYSNRIKALIESYFPNETTSLDTKSLSEDNIEISEEKRELSPAMKLYGKTLSHLANV